MGCIRFRHFCQSVFGGSNRARSPRLELLDNNQACVQLLSPGKCMPAVKPPRKVIVTQRIDWRGVDGASNRCVDFTNSETCRWVPSPGVAVLPPPVDLVDHLL